MARDLQEFACFPIISDVMNCWIFKQNTSSVLFENRTEINTGLVPKSNYINQFYLNLLKKQKNYKKM